MFSVKALFSKKRSGLTVLLGLVLLALLLCQWTPCPAEELEAKTSDVPAGDNMIRITADRLVTDTQSHNAEFIGNVHVLRNDMTIFSDSLKIFYTGSPSQGNQGQPGAESIQSIVAQGNVRIKFDDQTATTQRAEWSPQEQTIILTGPGSQIVSGKNSISGSKITVHQGDNRIRVEGGSNGRVEAQIFSDENELPLKQ